MTHLYLVVANIKIKLRISIERKMLNKVIGGLMGRLFKPAVKINGLSCCFSAKKSV
jgi:hypothetical protein